MSERKKERKKEKEEEEEEVTDFHCPANHHAHGQKREEKQGISGFFK